MRIRTLQWNIGGGLMRSPDSDPMSPLSYAIDGLDMIIEKMSEYNPDIITLQETHTDKARSQARVIAEALGALYIVEDIYDQSHLQEGQGLGQAVLARYPIKDHAFVQFYNPNMKTTSPHGQQWISNNKGVTSCTLTIGSTYMNVKTCHSFPYRRYKVEPLGLAMQPLREDMAKKLMPELPLFLLQSDLNYNQYSVRELLPALFYNGVQEVVLDRPTTPKGRKYDHVLYKGLDHKQTNVDASVLTDHFPVISDFEI